MGGFIIPTPTVLKTDKTTGIRLEPAYLLIKRPRLRPLHGQPTGCRRTWFEEPWMEGGSSPPTLVVIESY